MEDEVARASAGLDSDSDHEELCVGVRSGALRGALRGGALSPSPSMQRAFPMAESSWRTLAHGSQDHAVAVSARGELRCFGSRTCPTALQSFTLSACEMCDWLHVGGSPWRDCWGCFRLQTLGQRRAPMLWIANLFHGAPVLHPQRLRDVRLASC